MTIKQLVVIFGLLLFQIQLHAQVVENLEPSKQQEKSRFKDKLVFGGDFGLSFGTTTYIKIAPVIGYKITPRLTAGLGPIYIYERYKYDRYIGGTLQSSTYGGKVFASFTVLKGSESGGVLPIGNLLIHAENEVVSTQPLMLQVLQSYPYYHYYFGDRRVIDNLLLGFGLLQPVGGRFSVSIFILWDVTNNPYSLYSNPIIKFGFNF